MQAPTINSFKTLLSLSFIILLITSACAQSGSNTKTKSVAEKPNVNIQMAVLSGNLEAVKLHIEAGTNINEKDAMSGSTPLISAATFGKIDTVKALIDAKADLTIKNNDGATALHSAAFFCRVEIVQLLIDVNADKAAKNNFGMTPRESITVPFADMKSIYEILQLQLSPIDLQIDLNEIEKTRPVIAMMLQ
jgi:ankyrin repeat protein|tara:strand:+ start:4094 stop:4669 length:576 start_codon:yes stop_codon:yes gene_type:complete